MSTLLLPAWKNYKSPLRVVASFLWQSRENKSRKCDQLRLKLKESERQLNHAQELVQKQRQEIDQLKEIIQRRPSPTPICCLPDDPSVGTHGFGARMVCLAVNLAKVVGFRGACQIMAIFFEWLRVEQEIPHWTSVRNWMQRLGIAEIKKDIEPSDDWIWMADHSNQIGPEKVLVVLGIQAGNLPPPGTTLKHQDMHVLTVQPGTSWKRDDVAAVYNELAERYGPPRALLSDGAVELREAAKTLQNKRSDTIVLRDFKHKAANLLKAICGKSKRFEEFVSRVGQARSAIQQTELAHLFPPSIQQKARFMNLQTRLHWARVVLWLLDHPETPSRRWTSSERLEEKLGWLRSFADDIQLWCECEQVIETSVKFINEDGLFHGAADRLQTLVSLSVTRPASRQLAARLVDFVATAERDLKPGERLPMSTEILESSFSLYKQLEGQHSKEGFTGLLASFGALLHHHTPRQVRQSFSIVKTADVHQWITQNLGATLSSRRRQAYQEYHKQQDGATKPPPTT